MRSAEPGEPADPAQPAEPKAPADPADPADPANPANPAEPIELAHPAEPEGPTPPDPHDGSPHDGSPPDGPSYDGPSYDGPPYATSLHHAPLYDEPRTSVAALSLRYRIAVALTLAVVAIAVCVHVGMVFLHVAPSNTLTKQHGKVVYDWINPEFEQNWMLFAPNPLQQDIAVQVRAQVSTADGGTRTTRWYDLSAQDGRAIDGNLLPSHTQQNELRRAWDFFVSTHDGQNRATNVRGSLAETYLRRILVLRLGRSDAAGSDGVVERVQARSRTTYVRPPKWSKEQVPDTPVYRELSWWSVPDGEAAGGVR
ncbi:DUF5819 family protein [Streptomyces sp. NPDC005574]|uniref:DUF5819 family protein n=1 Tax=Streptomyces sp. NPDC005574 TaxID=3156891 RepID=UPI0033A2CA4E